MRVQYGPPSSHSADSLSPYLSLFSFLFFPNSTDVSLSLLLLQAHVLSRLLRRIQARSGSDPILNRHPHSSNPKFHFLRLKFSKIRISRNELEERRRPSSSANSPSAQATGFRRFTSSTGRLLPPNGGPKFGRSSGVSFRRSAYPSTGFTSVAGPPAFDSLRRVLREAAPRISPRCPALCRALPPEIPPPSPLVAVRPKS